MSKGRVLVATQVVEQKQVEQDLAVRGHAHVPRRHAPAAEVALVEHRLEGDVRGVDDATEARVDQAPAAST